MKPDSLFDHGEETLNQGVRTGAVGFVDPEQIRPFEQPRLHRLNDIPGLRDKENKHLVSHSDHFKLGLTDADGLNENPVEPRSGAENGSLVSRAAQAPVVPSGAERTNEHTRILRVRLHPNAIPQDRTTTEGAGRIDREHGDPMPVASQANDQSINKSRFPSAGGAGDPQNSASFPARPQLPDHAKCTLCTIFHPSNEA